MNASKYKLGHALLWLGSISILAGHQPLVGQEPNKVGAKNTPNAAPEAMSAQGTADRTLDNFRKTMKSKDNMGAGMDGAMGSGMEGAAMGMGGVPYSEKQLLAQLIQRLRERLNSKKHDRQLIEKQLRVALQQYFDADMEERVKELDKVKARLAETESKLQRRLNSDQEIIELQLKQMVHKADGLDFSIPNGNIGSSGYGGMGGMMSSMGGMGGLGMPGSAIPGMMGGMPGGSESSDGAVGYGEGGEIDSNSSPFGYDTMFGLTRVQRLDGEALDAQDPLQAYMKLSTPLVDKKPNDSNANKLKIILSAFHNFESQFHHLPRSANRHTRNQPPHSWRVAILPLIGYGDLYREYKFDQPWDSPENLRVASEMPELYRSTGGKSKDSTPFQMLVGEGAFDSAIAPPGFADITDGTSNTIALIQSADEIIWTRPEDVAYHINGSVQLSESRLVGLADGQVRTLPKDIGLEQFRAMVTRGAGETFVLP